MDALRQLEIAVKKYCLGCSGGSETERDKCKIKDCPLWKYRGAKNGSKKENENSKVRKKV